MNAGKIAAITGGVVSFVVIGGLLVVKKKYLISLFSSSPPASLTQEEIDEGYLFVGNSHLGKRLRNGQILISSPANDPYEDSDEDYDGGKRRRTRRKKKGRK
jgi:hypothetical protein